MEFTGWGEGVLFLKRGSKEVPIFLSNPFLDLERQL
jgi:hypothetical protein